MRQKATQKDRAAQRRKRLVAELLVTQQSSKLTLEEIAEAIAYPRNRRGRIDHTKASVAPNGRPWSRATIARDVQEVEVNWQRETLRDTASWKARIVAQYQELLEIYWRTGEYEGVERILAALRKTIGTDSDQVILFEQLQLQMSIAAQRLKAQFADRPELANEAFRALTGNPNANVFAVPNPNLERRTITAEQAEGDQEDDEGDE